MLDYLKSSPFYFLPHHFISWLIFHLARIKWTPVKKLSLDVYLSLHEVNMKEAEESNPYAYKNLNAFFTRALKKEARPLATGETTLLCPVDGTVSQAQPIKNGRVFQAKKHDYSLLELVGGNEKLAKPFQNGKFATLYLSPRDYHRIHMPLAGKLTDMIYVPGRLFSVAPHTVNTVPRLFARNERLVCAFETPAGPMIMILVGAINVSAIDTVWAGSVTPPSKNRITHTEYKNVDIRLDKGAEMGRFNLGSTVIMLMGENITLDDLITPDKTVRMGQAMATYTA
ncbi:MAG: archaetidylserine decarboxylase [Gammaproteobacteria bacterium]|nr:archaetidylserine decarboxylase [Gammaproteobacteria bacterium]MDH5735602.1 archaetidylserine decarboxylase [Gammaproteobacteria bacterium]